MISNKFTLYIVAVALFTVENIFKFTLLYVSDYTHANDGGAVGRVADWRVVVGSFQKGKPAAVSLPQGSYGDKLLPSPYME